MDDDEEDPDEDLEQQEESDVDQLEEMDHDMVEEKLFRAKEDANIEQMVEAVLFSAGRPLTVPEIEESIGRARSEVRSAVKKLRRMYQNRKTALEISKIGRKFSLQLKSEFNKYGMQMRDEEMSRPLLKTAALIAYYQPIRQSELKNMIGEKIYDHVDELKEKGLILSERDGRTYSLRTSPKFQEYFGLEAKDRNELKKLMAEKAGITGKKD
ncbi:MAG: SMC-Scp complex subunit ScpB [Candidatus Thermoplasmatota archaeon]